MTPRQIAQQRVDEFNVLQPVGTKVAYIKSQIEGKQHTTVKAPAYIQGDETPWLCWKA